ncbi:hypothetical protein [Sorangium sp. So ce426]|uniref:hypothetical protein n=1 Tax=Sorangium sp. So ce426 TaxID=3133312 RepID=UPI003F5B9EDD
MSLSERQENRVKYTDLHKEAPRAPRIQVDLGALTNQPRRDQALLAEAGISLDRALVALLVGSERFGPIGVVELLDRAGRDDTTANG